MILVCGVPRSGTSWIGKVLSSPNNIIYCYEPDNEHNNLLGYIYKQNIRRFPYLTSGAPQNGLYRIYDNVNKGRFLLGYGTESRAIKRLLGITLDRVEKKIIRKNTFLKTSDNNAFYPSVADRIRIPLAGKLLRVALLFKRRESAKKKTLVKSVHCILALPYIQYYFQPQMVLVLRHPANIVLSHLTVKNSDIWRNIFTQEELLSDYLSPYIKKVQELDHPLEKAAAQIAAFYFVLNEQLKNNSNWLVVHHEHFCLSPLIEFRKLFDRLHLKWSAGVGDLITDLNKKGKGYVTKRIAGSQIDKWNRELSTSQIEHIRAGYSIFPPAFYKDFASEEGGR